MLLHRKNDSRDASSTSLTRYADFATRPAGSCSTRKRNSRLTSTAVNAASMPASKLLSARASRNTFSSRATSASFTGRRYARRISVERICFAHASSSPGDFGCATKIRRRLGVSPGPFAANGPVTDN